MVKLNRNPECRLIDGDDIESARDMLHAAWECRRKMFAFYCDTGYSVKLDELLNAMADLEDPAGTTDIEVAFLIGRVADL
jgi:hypothetical protein